MITQTMQVMLAPIARPSALPSGLQVANRARQFLIKLQTSWIVEAFTLVLVVLATVLSANAESAQLERSGQPGINSSSSDTAIVFIDPQNEVLSEKGLGWGAVGASVTENKTVENMERIFKAAKKHGFEVFISPHYFFPTDQGWKFNGPLETDEAKGRMFARSGRLNLEGFSRSGADWLERFKPYIEDGKTVVASPHRVFGPQTNDLVLQLRKRGISKVILGGMLANMCVESHLRDLLEQGFQVAVAKDATAGPRHPKWGDGYQAALINFAFLAHAVLTTDQVVKALDAVAPR
jgi:nicotinamidase-related amidase